MAEPILHLNSVKKIKMHLASLCTQSACIWSSEMTRRQNSVLKELSVNGGRRFQNSNCCELGKHRALWEREAEERLPGEGGAGAECEA